MTETHGFELIESRSITELNTVAHLYRHRATGAELLSLENDDENKVFGITFRTPPADSTGIAHILEHSVLCGSAKYPLKEPFVELIKGSLQTFLNAMTYPDKTCYPVASTNLQDFYNLVDVYLDAVLHPRITPEVLQQEGWHYELSSADQPLRYKGVVFNEMKGANASPERVLYRSSQAELFPDHVYGVDSGGDPASIPDLTYEQFKNFHETYYHPTNARIFFYGDDPPAERLRLLNQVLSTFSRRPADTGIPLISRFHAPRHVEHAYVASEQEQAKGFVTVNWMLDEITDPELMLGLGILEHILIGTTASPLRKAMIDSGMGERMAGSGMNELRQLTFSSGLKGIDPDRAAELEDLIIGTLSTLAGDGIDTATIEASLNTIEFALRENNTGSYPRGLSLMLRALSTWLYDGDPFAQLTFEAPLTSLKHKLSSGERYFENLIQRYLLDNPHRVTVVLRPDTELNARQEAAERARLDAAQARMQPADIQAVIDQTAHLQALQEAADPPEALDLLPSLKLSDIPTESKTIPIEVLEQHNTPVFYHNLFTNGIVYLDFGLDLRAVPSRLLPYVRLLGRAFLETGTQQESAVQLQQRIGRETGGIHMALLSSSVRGSTAAVARLFLRGKATVSQTPELLAILADVLHHARLDNRERMRQIVLEEKAAREAALAPNGHSIVNMRLRAGLTEADWLEEHMAGISYLLFLRELVNNIDQHWEAVQADLEQLRTLIVQRGNALTNITVDADSWRHIAPQLDGMLANLPQHNLSQAGWQRDALPAREGLIIPAQVNYVGKGANLYDLGYQLDGSAMVASRYLRASWLWEQVRVRGGAYGGFCVFDSRSGVFSFLSYRDPNLMNTLGVYDRSAGFLRDLDLSEKERTRAIIGTISDLDSYQLPDARGYTSMVRQLVGDDDSYRQQIREQVLSTTRADFQAFGDVLAGMRDTSRIVVMGGESALQAANAELQPPLALTRVL